MEHINKKFAIAAGGNKKPYTTQEVRTLMKDLLEVGVEDTLCCTTALLHCTPQTTPHTLFGCR